MCWKWKKTEKKRKKKFSGLPMAVTIGKLTISLPMARAICKAAPRGLATFFADGRPSANKFCRRLHMWRCLGFNHPTLQLARNFLKFLPHTTHAMPTQLVKFRQFRTPFGFYRILKHFPGTSLPMLRGQQGRNFMRGPGYGLKILRES